MAKGLNLKTTFSADAQPIKKGAKESQEAIKEFEGKASSSIDAFAGLFGTSMAQITAGVRTLQGGLLMMNKGLQGSATSTGLFSKSLAILKVALISTGIGAIVVALGALVAYFKRSQDGADALTRAMAPVKVLFNAIGDIAAALGRAMVKAFQDPKQAISDMWEALKKNIINRFVGIVDSFKGLGKVIMAAFTFDWEGVKNGAKEVGSAMLQFTTGLDKQQRDSIAKWMGEKSAETAKWMKDSQTLADREAALNKKKIEFIREEARLNAAYADNREKASDTETYDAEQRLAFSKKAEGFLLALYAKRIALKKEEATIKQGQADLDNAVDLNAETEEVARLWAEIDTLTADMDMSLKGLNKEQKKLNAEVKTELEARTKMSTLRANIIPEIDDSKVENKANKVVSNLNTKISAIKLRAIVDPDYEKNLQKWQEDLMVAQEFSAAISAAIKQSFVDIAVGVGETLGKLMAGEGQWSDFGSMVLGVLANLAITVGTIAITMGTSVIAIKSSLTSMNGYIAIAAGIALVALGTWAKSSLSKATSGSGTGTFSGNSYNVSAGSGISKSSNSSSGYEARLVTVNVTGTLKASGGDLVAVINNENKRKRLTT